jgi:hypothetical protein
MEEDYYMKIFNRRNISHVYAWIAHIFIFHLAVYLFLDLFIKNNIIKYILIFLVFINLVVGHTWGCSWIN